MKTSSREEFVPMNVEDVHRAHAEARFWREEAIKRVLDSGKLDAPRIGVLAALALIAYGVVLGFGIAWLVL